MAKKKDRWEVRRQRFMYDMLGLIKKGKVHCENTAIKSTVLRSCLAG